MVTRAVNDDPLNIEAVFESAGSTVEFHANLLFGVVSTSVRASSPETATTSGDNGGPVTTGAPHHDDGGSDDTHDGHHSHPGGPGPGGGSDD